MDADRNIIPVVEDDQGEGYKDPLDPEVLEEIAALTKPKPFKPGLRVTGTIIEQPSGTKYEVDKGGSWRRIK